MARNNIRYGNIPDMEALEQGMREAALRDESKALSGRFDEYWEHRTAV